MWQEILAYVIIAATLVWVVWRIFFRKDKGCDCPYGCDGCPYCASSCTAPKSLCLANEKISERHSPAQSFSSQDVSDEAESSQPEANGEKVREGEHQHILKSEPERSFLAAAEGFSANKIE